MHPMLHEPSSAIVYLRPPKETAMLSTSSAILPNPHVRGGGIKDGLGSCRLLPPHSLTMPSSSCFCQDVDTVRAVSEAVKNWDADLHTRFNVVRRLRALLVFFALLACLFRLLAIQLLYFCAKECKKALALFFEDISHQPHVLVAMHRSDLPEPRESRQRL